MAPPRNRRRKVGSMRIDAALDSMRPMGFPDDVVRKSIKDLLKQEGRAGRDDGSGSGEKSGSLEEMCDKEERCQEQKCLPVEIDAEKSPSKNSQTHHHFISKDDSGQPQLGPPVDFAPTYSPMDRVPTNQTQKPSCGWLDADDEED
ncbi:uncharacterized protein LOC113762952 isoform X2 [Coffea eugenioides]|uniref:uncharacterized protein LOC113762952 isoform X2 n=1 Tax=Coffea eugenioides TaxID=49369 RepID=UPI000F613D80|nr:uncharacterized protein LOC113762952 isoform X2 [Coffea eugenioides]